MYSSATKRNIERGIHQLEEYLRQHSASPAQAPLQQRSGGNVWDVVKPLKQHGLNLSRTILVDHNSWKSTQGEEHNMLLIPEYVLPHIPPNASERQQLARVSLGSGRSSPSRQPGWPKAEDR
jgi:hypothetical protein